MHEEIADFLSQNNVQGLSRLQTLSKQLHVLKGWLLGGGGGGVVVVGSDTDTKLRQERGSETKKIKKKQRCHSFAPPTATPPLLRH